MSKGRRHLPWITPPLKRQMRKRDRLFKKAHSQSCSTAWTAYRQYRNRVAKNVHRARCEYINNIIGASLKDNPKSFWSNIKTCRSENIGIPTLRTPSKLCASALDKAETLNDYFQSVFTPHQSHPLVQKGPSHFPTIGHLHVHRTGVEKRLQQLDPSKASGPDELPPKLLKLVAREIASPLSSLFQQSYNSGIVPAQWKQALVTLYTSREKSVTPPTTDRSHLPAFAAKSWNTSSWAMCRSMLQWIISSPMHSMASDEVCQQPLNWQQPSTTGPPSFSSVAKLI